MGRIHDKLYPQISSLNKVKGFTLIELLIVIGVLGVLATVLLIIIDPVKQLQRARDTKRKANIAQIQQALELYRADRNVYPGSLPLCNGNLIVSGVTYLRGMPCDPKDGTAYVYTPSASPILSYTIRACLENTSDIEKDSGSTPCATGAGYTRANP